MMGVGAVSTPGAGMGYQWPLIMQCAATLVKHRMFLIWYRSLKAAYELGTYARAALCKATASSSNEASADTGYHVCMSMWAPMLYVLLLVGSQPARPPAALSQPWPSSALLYRTWLSSCSPASV